MSRKSAFLLTAAVALSVMTSASVDAAVLAPPLVHIQVTVHPNPVVPLANGVNSHGHGPVTLPPSVNNHGHGPVTPIHCCGLLPQSRVPPYSNTYLLGPNSYSGNGPKPQFVTMLQAVGKPFLKNGTWCENYANGGIKVTVSLKTGKVI